MLACDIDGTILDGHGALRPAVRDAIRAIAASGVEVVLATGRSPWSGVAELAAELGLPGLHITMQGALTSQPATGRIARLRALPPGLYREAVRFAHETGIEPVVAMVDGHRAVRKPPGVDFLAVPGSETGRFRRIADLDALADEQPVRVYLPTGPARHWGVRLAARAHFGTRASVVWGDQQGLEILAPGVHKAGAVAWLAAARGIARTEVAAVGDAANDLEMLRDASRSAAMGSAPADVCAAADIVVPSSDDDGALSAFDWFFPDLARPAPLHASRTYARRI